MIPMLNLKRQYDDIKDELLPAMADVMQSMRYVLGPRVKEMETRVAEYMGSKMAVGVASGTDALHLSVKSLDIAPGDEVITTPFTFFATVESIIYEGAIPVFVDIDPETYNMDTSQIEAAITDRTRAIMPVHMFGHPADMTTVMSIADKHKLGVIEDCAQSFGASLNGQMTGSFGACGCFSFYPSKNLGACGDGGMITLNDEALGADMMKLRNHGSAGNYIHDEIGFNSRLDELQAAILLVKLKRIDEYNNRRRARAKFYTEQLSAEFKCPTELDGAHHVYHQYTIRSTERDALKSKLAEAEISSMIYYPIPLHLQPALEYLGHKEGSFPRAEQAASEVLSLPICPELNEQEQSRVVDALLQKSSSRP